MDFVLSYLGSLDLLEYFQSFGIFPIPVLGVFSIIGDLHDHCEYSQSLEGASEPFQLTVSLARFQIPNSYVAGTGRTTHLVARNLAKHDACGGEVAAISFSSSHSFVTFTCVIPEKYL